LQKPTVKIPDDEEAKFIWQKHMSVEIITKNYVNFAKTYVESQEHQCFLLIHLHLHNEEER
jgi:hypothetical protein